MKKVLIVIFTNGRLPRSVYKAACSQDYPETSVLLSVRKPDPALDKHGNITAHLNYARGLAKSSDADYFFFVDSDLVIPKNAVSSLMMQFNAPAFDPKMFPQLEQQFGKLQPPKPKHIIGGWYQLAPKTKEHGILWSPSRWIADNVLVSLQRVEPSLVRVDKIASGCIMLSREVMEGIEWRSGLDLEINHNPSDGTHSHPCQCAVFGNDAAAAGYELWVDGSVVCKHLSVEGWGARLRRIFKRGE